MIHTIDCPHCHASGRQHSPDRAGDPMDYGIPCPICDGAGVVAAAYPPCPSCGDTEDDRAADSCHEDFAGKLPPHTCATCGDSFVRCECCSKPVHIDIAEWGTDDGHYCPPCAAVSDAVADARRITAAD